MCAACSCLVDACSCVRLWKQVGVRCVLCAVCLLQWSGGCSLLCAVVEAGGDCMLGFRAPGNVLFAVL